VKATRSYYTGEHNFLVILALGIDTYPNGSDAFAASSGARRLVRMSGCTVTWPANLFGHSETYFVACARLVN
jgi:hypothetical protein